MNVAKQPLCRLLNCTLNKFNKKIKMNQISSIKYLNVTKCYGTSNIQYK